MTLDLVPGNALGCRTNAHRHGWDGSICEDARDWACGIEAEFRAKYCAAGTPRCFHLHLFDEEDPHLVIPDSGVGWLLGQHPDAFDDQVLLVWAPQAEEPHGLVTGRPVGSFMAGAYRIERVERIEQRNHVEWKVFPYEDGWTYLGSLDCQAPRFMHLNGPYIKQVDRSAVGPLFENALEAGAEVSEDFTQAEKERLEHFAANVDEWLAGAEERVQELLARSGTRVATIRPAKEPPTPMPRPRAASNRGSNDGRELPTRLIPLPPKPPAAALPDRYPLIESSRQEAIESTYGASTLRALQVAALTHPLVLLRGPAGVGKSRLALEFIEDPQRERSLVVTAAADWEGPQDLFGRLNRTSGLFEPTLFTNFMRAAELAWRGGDFETRVVVFENFDQAKAETWLSELLLRAQYPAMAMVDRTVQLPGEAVRGWGAEHGTRLFISPAVRFVATVDEPLRQGALTPRLLDRIGVVELSLTTADSLRLAGASVTPKQQEALVTLDAFTRELHAGVTISTGRAIRRCQESLDDLGVDAWRALDLVLEQQVVAKVELLDPSTLDGEAARRAVEWAAGPGKKLTRSATRLAAWAAAAEQAERAALTDR